MPELAEDAAHPGKAGKGKPGKANSGGALAVVRKRWRAWLRAVHRDIGYLAVGFTVIYALSGIAMNHIEDWDPNFHATEITRKITPIPADLSDAEAARRIAAAAGLTEAPDEVYRAGDEVRLTLHGAKITAIGDTLTFQHRRDRFFFRVADWLHATRGKQAWKYIADAYAVLLLYLAISGIFMIKGRLGLRWRGASLIALGLAAPIGYIVLSGGPGAQNTERVATRPGEVEQPDAAKPGDASARPDRMRPLPDKPASKPGADEIPQLPADDKSMPATGDGIRALPPDDDKPASGDGIRPLPPDDDEVPAKH